jgi:hypothetical protein
MYFLGASGNVNNNSRIKEENAFTGYEAKAAGLAQYVIDANSSYQQAEIGKVQLLAQTVACDSKQGGDKIDVAIDAYAIGDFALVGAPYEMYCENGEAIKEGSPFKMTFVSTCTNGYNSYIPSSPTYEYGGYEFNGTDLAQGSGERLADTFVSMLNRLHG